MSIEAKKAAIIRFVVDIEKIRDEAKADAIAMLERVPLEILGDADALEEYFTEMLEAVAAKHLVTRKMRMRPKVAAAVRRYIDGMTRGDAA
jgi:hypothetical protein